MAFPTAVNDQITDAVTQNAVHVLGAAPAMAMGAIYQALAQASGLLFQNAVSAQQQGATIAQAVTAQGVAHLYAVGGMAAAAGAAKIAQSDVPDTMLALAKARGAAPPATPR